MRDKIVEHLDLENCGYTVVWEPDHSIVQFRVYGIVGLDGETGRPLYTVFEPDEFHRDYVLWDGLGVVPGLLWTMNGDVRWDGCGNIWFKDQEENLGLHLCDVEGAEQYCKLIKYLWTRGKELASKELKS